MADTESNAKIYIFNNACKGYLYHNQMIALLNVVINNVRRAASGVVKCNESLSKRNISGCEKQAIRLLIQPQIGFTKAPPYYTNDEYPLIEVFKNNVKNVVSSKKFKSGSGLSIVLTINVLNLFPKVQLNLSEVSREHLNKLSEKYSGGMLIINHKIKYKSIDEIITILNALFSTSPVNAIDKLINSDVLQFI